VDHRTAVDRDVAIDNRTWIFPQPYELVNSSCGRRAHENVWKLT
jgi:hypothetical protein